MLMMAVVLVVVVVVMVVVVVVVVVVLVVVIVVVIVVVVVVVVVVIVILIRPLSCHLPNYRGLSAPLVQQKPAQLYGAVSNTALVPAVAKELLPFPAGRP